MRKKNLRTYINLAGQVQEVAEYLGKSRIALWNWQQKGFPDSEYSGRTTYCEQIAEMCLKNGHVVDPQQILDDSYIET